MQSSSLGSESRYLTFFVIVWHILSLFFPPVLIYSSSQEWVVRCYWKQTEHRELFSAFDKSSSGKHQQDVNLITIQLRLMKNEINTTNHYSVDLFFKGKLLWNVYPVPKKFFYIHINSIDFYSYSSLLAHLQLDSRKKSVSWVLVLPKPHTKLIL